MGNNDLMISSKTVNLIYKIIKHPPFKKIPSPFCDASKSSLEYK